jgi:hypothetical protein
VFAFDATSNVPKTGDAANITAYVSKDYGAVTVLADTAATEMDATNAPGYYLFDAAQAETNADCLMVSAKSATANIKALGAPAVIYTRPTTGWLAPATAGRTLVVDAAGLADANMVKAGPTGSGTAITARDIGASVLLSSGTGTGQVSLSSGLVDITQAAADKAWSTAARTLTAGTNIQLPSNGLANVTAWTVALTGDITGNLSGSVGSVTGAVGSVTGSVGSVVGAVGSVTGAVGSVTGAVGSVTGNVGGNVVGTVASVVGAVGSVTGLTASNLDTTVSSRLATAGYTAPPTAAQNATAVLTTQMTESYSTDGAAPTLTQSVMLTQQMLYESSVAGTTLTVKKVDGSTTAATATLNDSAAPTSITRAT